VKPLGLDVRAGLHTGECELIGDKVGGVAVHVCARVAAKALPGEVLVSRTVKDLVAGSGIEFVDRGVQHLITGSSTRRSQARTSACRRRASTSTVGRIWISELP
jgi:class 3 adenylate cyclase